MGCGAKRSNHALALVCDLYPSQIEAALCADMLRRQAKLFVKFDKSPPELVQLHAASRAMHHTTSARPFARSLLRLCRKVGFPANVSPSFIPVLTSFVHALIRSHLFPAPAGLEKAVFPPPGQKEGSRQLLPRLRACDSPPTRIHRRTPCWESAKCDVSSG